MSEDELSGFLERCTELWVGVLDEEGELDVGLASLELDDGRLVLHFDPEDPILRHLEAGRVICAQADESPSYYEIKGVVLSGRPQALGSFSFVLMPTKTISFDFGKLPDRMT